MKTLLGLLLIVASLNSFANLDDGLQEYVGSDDGAACKVYFNPTTDHVAMGGVGLGPNISKTIKDNKVILVGTTDFMEGRVTLTLKSNKELKEAKLETKSLLFPIFMTKLNCKELVRTK